MCWHVLTRFPKGARKNKPRPGPPRSWRRQPMEHQRRRLRLVSNCGFQQYLRPLFVLQYSRRESGTEILPCFRFSVALPLGINGACRTHNWQPLPQFCDTALAKRSFALSRRGAHRAFYWVFLCLIGRPPPAAGQFRPVGVGAANKTPCGCARLRGHILPIGGEPIRREWPRAT